MGSDELVDIAREIISNEQESGDRRFHLRGMVMKHEAKKREKAEKEKKAQHFEKMNVLHVGWLEKKNSHGRRKFSKRFFKLLRSDGDHGNSPVLQYYSSPPNLAKRQKGSSPAAAAAAVAAAAAPVAPNGTILLDGCSVVNSGERVNGDKTTFTFEIRHPTRQSRLFKYSSDDDSASKNQWTSRINECLKSYKKECKEEEAKDPAAAQERRHSIKLAEGNMRSESDDER